MKFSGRISLAGTTKNTKLPHIADAQSNFFENKNLFEFKNGNTKQSPLNFIPKRNDLNELDSNLINKISIKTAENEPLKLEMVIQGHEKRIKETEEHYKYLKLFELGKREDYELLEQKKKQLKKELKNCKTQYRELGTTYLIADVMSDTLNGIKNFFKNLTEKFNNSKFAKKLCTIFPSLGRRKENSSNLEKLKAIQGGVSSIIFTPNKDKYSPEKVEELSILLTHYNKFDNPISEISEKAKEKELKTTVENIFKKVN